MGGGVKMTWQKMVKFYQCCGVVDDIRSFFDEAAALQMCKGWSGISFWLLNIATYILENYMTMEKQPFEDVSPTKKWRCFPLSC